MQGDNLISENIGVVAIGRNEGARLKRCLESALNCVNHVVYVDSGSVDDSTKVAQSMGVVLVELDMSLPFTAARARNIGFRQLLEVVPDLEFVQFVDGDCELDSNWTRVAAEFLETQSDIVVVCGRLRERHPDKSIYNLLCDMEWTLPAGETLACGGNAFYKKVIFQQTNGFRDDLIAGEEPELCMRIRKLGWKIWRLDNQMALHDANMTSFFQWWKRTMRGGYTYAQGIHDLDRDCFAELSRALIWGGVIPLVIILLLAIWGSQALFLLFVYPLQVLRLALKSNMKFSHSLLRGLFLTIGKFPEMIGILKYYCSNLFGVKSRLMEYK